MTDIDPPWEPPLAGTETEHLLGSLNRLRTTFRWKADGLDLTPLLAQVAKPRPNVEVVCTKKQDHGLDLALDKRLIALAKKSIQSRKKTREELPIANRY